MVNEEEYKWLYDEINGLKEKIVFRNRIEYRVNGKIHNSKGPAIIHTYDPLTMEYPSENDYKEYYINGNKLTEEEWSIYNREYKIKKIMKKSKQKREIN